MKYDFIIKYDPSTQTLQDIAKRIIWTLIVFRLKRNFPVTILVGGKSGSGKSLTTNKLMQIICELEGIDYLKFIDDVNCYSPIEYMTKSDALLNNPELKKVNVLAVHESRLLISAKQWQSLTAQTVNNTINLQRAIKPQCLFLVTQHIKDITVDTRRSLDYYFKVYRPAGHKARLYIELLYMDERDLENPKLRSRRIRGKLIYPDGQVKILCPEYIEITMPDKAICEHFAKRDYETKAPIIARQLKEQINELQKTLGVESGKLDFIVKYYSDNPEALFTLAKKKRSGWKLGEDAIKMHDLTREDIKIVEARITANMKNKPMMFEESIPEKTETEVLNA